MSIYVSLFFISLIINYFFIKYYDSKRFNYKIQIQNIHDHSVSRFGGYTFIICMIYISLFNREIFLLQFILISLIAIIPAILEDLNFEIKPIIRLLLTLICCFILIMSFDQLPLFNFGYFNLIFNNNIFQIIFFTLCLAIVTNGQNMIDGANGLSGFSSITTFSCIFYISTIYNDELLKLVSLSILILIFSFLIFNFPKGLIFLGDSGSYFLGLTGGFFIIYAFSKYDQMPSWSAAVILFYPTFEVVFSYFRKIKNKKSPLLPDKHHLHLLIFQILKSDSSAILYKNSITSVFLSLIWLSPLAIFPISLKNVNISFIFLIVLTLVYLSMYFIVNKIYLSISKK